jgi:hypothetical protein
LAVLRVPTNWYSNDRVFGFTVTETLSAPVATVGEVDGSAAWPLSGAENSGAVAVFSDRI